MNTFKLKSGPGDHFDEITKRAKEIAKNTQQVVEFTFNDIQCFVNSLTVGDWLFRDYCNAHIMEWKSVGPETESEYHIDTQIELYSRKLAKAKERKISIEEMHKKDDAQRKKVMSLIKDIKLIIISDKEDEYNTYVETNSKDGYSRGVIDYADYWGRLMQKEIAMGKTIAQVADATQQDLGFLGITGFMYGCAVSALSKFWIHGEDLRKWHNKQYGKEDGEGVVNPSILTIGVK